MKSRKEIKALAKTAFKARYWFCVGMAVLMGIIIGALTGTCIGAIVLVGPISIGLNYLWICIFAGMDAEAGTPFNKAFEGFGRKLGGYWWMILHLFLWFFIPICNIIKPFAYAMTPYILSDCPNVKGKDALHLSRVMMKGHKWQLFVFELSFLGWDLLTIITFGLVGIFYAVPFQSTAMAGWYLELREQCLREGVVTADQLNGVEAGAAPVVEAPVVEAPVVEAHSDEPEV